MRVPYLIRRPSSEQSLSVELEGLFHKPKAGLECAKEFSATTHLYTSKTVEKMIFVCLEKDINYQTEFLMMISREIRKARI